MNTSVLIALIWAGAAVAGAWLLSRAIREEHLRAAYLLGYCEATFEANRRIMEASGVTPESAERLGRMWGGQVQAAEERRQ